MAALQLNQETVEAVVLGGGVLGGGGGGSLDDGRTNGLLAIQWGAPPLVDLADLPGDAVLVTASAVGSRTGSLAKGVRRFSRLFSHQVWAAPELVTMLPKPGFAWTLTQGSGVSRSPSRTTTYSRPSRVKPPSPFSMTRSGGATGSSTSPSMICQSNSIPMSLYALRD